MGAWGTGIFDNDWVMDIKEDYSNALKYSKDDDDALQIFIKEHKAALETPDDGPLIWLVLAQSMWKKGRLTDEILQKANQAAKDDLKNWENAAPKDYAKRKKNLDKFISALSEPQPEAMPIKRIEPFKCNWKKGDVFLWKNNDIIAVRKEKNDNQLYCFEDGGLVIIFDETIDYCGLSCVKFYLKFSARTDLTIEDVKKLPYIRYSKWVQDKPDNSVTCEDYHIVNFYGQRWVVAGEGRLCDEFYSYATVIKGMDFVKKLKYIGSCGEDIFPVITDSSEVNYREIEQLFECAVNDYANNNKHYYKAMLWSKRYYKQRDNKDVITLTEF